MCFRYELLTPNVIPKGFMDGKKACEKMVGVMYVQERFMRLVWGECGREIMCPCFESESNNSVMQLSFL